MRPLFRIALTAAITATLLPSVAHGQAAKAETLLRKVDSLQARIDMLENRIIALENLLKATPARGIAKDGLSNSRDITNWRRLREGMSMKDVRSLLGEAERINGGTVASWYYPHHGNVIFVSGKLNAWTEPSP